MSRLFKLDYIPDPDRGRPLFGAKIYVGVPNQDPTIPANQIQLTGDIGFPLGGVVNLDQPVRTNNGGVTVYNNAPVLVNNIGQPFSIAIYDRFDDLVYNLPNVDGDLTFNNTAQEQVVGGVIYPEISTLDNGMIVPSGTTHLRVLIDGVPTLVFMHPLSDGVVSDLTEIGATIGGVEVIFFYSQKKNTVSLNSPAIDKSGLVDSSDAVAALFNYANEKKLKVEDHDGTILLSGNSDITINTETDLSGVKFDINGWTGRFIIDRGQTYDEYFTGSDEVDLLNSVSFGAGRTGLYTLPNNNITSLDNTYIRIHTNEDFYEYREDIYKRVEHNRLFNRGTLDRPLKYALNQDITKIEAMTILSTPLNVKGLSFIETDLVSSEVLIIQNSTRVNLDVTSYSKNESESFVNPTRLLINDSAVIRINGLYCNYVNKTSDNDFTYTISMNDCYDVVVDDATSDGLGWGATGNNESSCIEFKNCHLSRIDFHRPVFGYLKTNNVEIGEWGIMCTLCCDWTGNDVTYIPRDGYNNDGLFRSRSDMGGWCDGKAIITDLKINGLDNSSVDPLFLCNGSALNDIPVGSPINPAFFTSIHVNGLYRENCGNSVVALQANVSTGLYVPDIDIAKPGNCDSSVAFSNISIVGLEYFVPKVTVTASADPRTSQYTSTFVVRDGVCDNFTLNEGASDHMPLIKLINLTSSERGPLDLGRATGVSINVKQQSRLSISNTDIQTLSQFSDGYLPAGEKMYVTVNGGKWDSQDAGNANLDWDGKSLIECVGVNFITYTTAQRTLIADSCKLSGCSVSLKVSDTTFTDFAVGNLANFNATAGTQTAHLFVGGVYEFSSGDYRFKFTFTESTVAFVTQGGTMTASFSSTSNPYEYDITIASTTDTIGSLFALF